MREPSVMETASARRRGIAGGRRQGIAGLSLIAASLAGYWLTALVGPSAASHALPSGGALPPYTVGLEPSALTVTTLLYVATACGAAGLLLAWKALRAGWSPPVRRLLVASAAAVLAFCVVPPLGSDDVFSYAAYGRLAATGYDPYTTRPVDLPADPVISEVTPPWRDTPSVYGPVATGLQTAVMRAADDSVRWGVMGMVWLAAAAFLATVAMLDRYAGGPAARRRAALLFGLNPLLIYQLVAGAHIDVLVALAVVGAVVSVARAPWLAGLLVGGAVSIKLSAGLAALGLAWHLRHQTRDLAALVVAGVIVVVPGYLLVGGAAALDQARMASRFVSHATFWRPVAVQLDRAVGHATSRNILSTLSLLLFAAVTVLLWRRLPDRGSHQAGSAEAEKEKEGRAEAVGRDALAPTLAWLLAATYLLPWYHASAWALLALLVWSRWDTLLLATTTMLTVAYVPGRAVPLPGGVAGVTRFVRAGAGPVVLGALLVWAVAIAVRRVGDDPPTSRSTPSPAES